MLRMQRRGYKLSVLRRKLKHHLRKFPDTYGDTNGDVLFAAIQNASGLLSSMPNWEVDAAQLTGWIGQVDQQHVAACMQVDDASDFSEWSESEDSELSELFSVSD